MSLKDKSLKEKLDYVKENKEAYYIVIDNDVVVAIPHEEDGPHEYLTLGGTPSDVLFDLFLDMDLDVNWA